MVAPRLAAKPAAKAASKPTPAGKVAAKAAMKRVGIPCVPGSEGSLPDDPKEIRRLAVQLEGRAILFYTGMKDLVPAGMGRARLDTIINEEKSHIMWLNRFKSSFKSREK